MSRRRPSEEIQSSPDLTVVLGDFTGMDGEAMFGSAGASHPIEPQHPENIAFGEADTQGDMAAALGAHWRSRHGEDGALRLVARLLDGVLARNLD